MYLCVYLLEKDSWRRWGKIKKRIGNKEDPKRIHSKRSAYKRKAKKQSSKTNSSVG